MLDIHTAAPVAVVVVGDLAVMQIKQTAAAAFIGAGLYAAAVFGDLAAVHMNLAAIHRRTGAAAGDLAAVDGHICACGIGPDINTDATAAPDHTVKDVGLTAAVNIDGLILRCDDRPQLCCAVRQVQLAGGYLNGAAAVLFRDRVPVQTQRPRQHGHLLDHHILRQVVIARDGQRIAAGPGLECHICMFLMIPDILGAVLRMAADAVGVLAKRPHDKVFAVRENGVGLRIVRKEAGRVGRAAAGQTDRAARRQLTLLFRRDADVGHAVQRPDGDGFSIRQNQVSVGVSGNLHLAGDRYIAAALNALIASGDGAAVHDQRAVVCHAGAAGGGDGAAVHGECTLIVNTDTTSGGNGAVGDGQHTAVFNFAGKGAVLQGKAAASLYGHISVNGAAAAVGQGEAALHGHISVNAVPVHAEGHIIAQRLHGGERHITGQVVAARSVRQGIGLLPRGQLLFPVQVGDQAVIAGVIIDPAMGGIRYGEIIHGNAVLIPEEVLPPGAVPIRLSTVELVGHLAGGERRFVRDRRTGHGGHGGLAVILPIVAVFHDAAVGVDNSC